MRTLCEEQPQIEPVFKQDTSCKGKHRYNTRAKAERFSERFSEVSNTPIQTCYHCLFCHGWHLSTLMENDASWIARKRREEIRRTKKIKKAKWRFCVQNIGIDVPEDEDEHAVLVPYGETYEMD